MAVDQRNEQRRRMEAEAEADRRPGDPTATKPRDARRIGLIIGAALLIGVVAQAPCSSTTAATMATARCR